MHGLFVRLLMLLAAYIQYINLFMLIRRRRRRVQRRWWIRPVWRSRQIHGAFTTLFRELKATDEEEFFAFTRMTVRQFDRLVEMVRPYLTKRSIRTPLPVELRVAATLSYLAHGDSVRNKSWQFRVGNSTMFKIVKETCVAIKLALQPTYLAPPNAEQWTHVPDVFWEKWNFPNCIGSIDGKHVRVKAPPNSGTLYFNYKKYFSIILLAACDAEYKFLWVDIGDYGSHNDAGVFASSTFGRALAGGNANIPGEQPLPGTDVQMPLCFVGDEAFPLKSYLMRPYPRRALIDDHQKIFNYRLSRARRVVENAFGILVARWAVLNSPICFKIETTECIVFALACLHNYLIADEQNENVRYYNAPGLVDQERPNGEVIEGEWRRLNAGNGFDRLGRIGANFRGQRPSQQRDALARYFLSPAGAVPWQHLYI